MSDAHIRFLFATTIPDTLRCLEISGMSSGALNN
jgi:hypothetical protein